jgi:hypothetical protein
LEDHTIPNDTDKLAVQLVTEKNAMANICLFVDEMLIFRQEKTNSFLIAAQTLENRRKISRLSVGTLFAIV